MNYVLRSLTGITLLLVIASACSTGEAQRAPNNAAPNTAGASPSPLPMPAKTFTEADLAKLRWIVGSWKGTGGGAEPFYEKYTFRDARTLAVDSFENDSLEKVTDTSLFNLENGHFTNGHYALSDITEDAATFVPVVSTSRNSFVWRKETDSTWKAVLTWPATETKPANERVYNMARLEERK